MMAKRKAPKKLTLTLTPEDWGVIFQAAETYWHMRRAYDKVFRDKVRCRETKQLCDALIRAAEAARPTEP